MPKPIQKLKGMRDILPADQKYFRYVCQTVGDLLEKSGFQRIDTPILEPTKLFERTIGESTAIVEKEMYTFNIKGEESVTLRPEGTASVARAYIEHGMHTWPQPVQLFYIGKMFRHEKPQAGRYREFTQIGFEIFGDSHPLTDATLISLIWQIYEKFGLKDLVLEINSIGCSSCRPKMRKALIEYYKDKLPKLCEDCKRRFKKNPFRLLDCKISKCRRIAEKAPHLIDLLCEECRAHFTQVLEALDELGVPYDLNPKLVRGLDYYNRTTFEIIPAKKINKQQAALGAGGRYDGLIELLGGPPTPAIGFALGVDRVVGELIEKKIEVPEKRKKVQVFVAALGELAKKKSLKIIKELRQLNFSVMSALGKESIKAQLKLADKLEAEYTLIIGEKEARANTVLIRDMLSGVQESVEEEDLIKRLNELIEEKKQLIKENNE